MPDETLHPSISTNTQAIADFCTRWGINELSLFGSVLRDDFRPDSDIDVLISFAPDADWDYWDWPAMKDDLRAILGRPIDLVVKESLRNPFRRHRILRERRVIHAA
ncbi:MAG: nucleotidyltransferase family protein [Planctomycetota bacterium]